jgi:hypothetical protein
MKSGNGISRNKSHRSQTMTSMWCNRPNGRSIRLLTVTEATACQAVEHSPSAYCGSLRGADMVLEDRPSYFRHAQICTASFNELRAALEKAYSNGWSAFVIVSRSFQLIKDRWSVPAPSQRRIVSRRLEDSCQCLSENGTRFQTSVFQGLGPSDVLKEQPGDTLKGGIVRTVLRHAEQAAGRIW